MFYIRRFDLNLIKLVKQSRTEKRNEKKKNSVNNVLLSSKSLFLRCFRILVRYFKTVCNQVKPISSKIPYLSREMNAYLKVKLTDRRKATQWPHKEYRMRRFSKPLLLKTSIHSNYSPAHSQVGMT